MEYIDRQKILCAVVTEANQQRLRLFNENSRELKMAAGRLSHESDMRIDLSEGRDRAAAVLKEKAAFRNELAETIDIRELWEVLNSEQEWIDLETMTAFCFPEDPTGDHESAVVRAFFQDRRYFKFDPKRFFPYTEEQVAQLRARAEEAARKARLVEGGGDWISRILSGTLSVNGHQLTADQQRIVQVLKSYYLFEKESRDQELARAILKRAGIVNPDILFKLFVSLKIWRPDENIDILRFEVPTAFSEDTLQRAAGIGDDSAIRHDPVRRDLTDLRTFTIDGQATLDYDDALSLENFGDHYRLGIHIADVSHFVEMGGPVDREAELRGSTIYMPDQKIPMLPEAMAEGHCSLKAGEVRPAISTMIRLTPGFEILDHEIVPSVIRVTDQLTYYDVNLLTDENEDFQRLFHVARQFRKARLEAGAVHISLPEINIWLDEEGELVLSKTNRESPGRMLVAELMIMANWLTARFLWQRGLPAIFRSQPDPRERLYKHDEGTLFQNWMQRKLLNRFVLSPDPERHSGLGLDAYVTATSPIRKYSDLVTQRQIRAAYGMERPYTRDEIEKIIGLLAQPMMHVSRLQARRKRYWMLKYLEKRIGRKEEAIVLDKRKNSYLALITEYLMECNVPVSNGIKLKPEDLIQVTIQHVDARKDLLAVYMG